MNDDNDGEDDKNEEDNNNDNKNDEEVFSKVSTVMFSESQANFNDDNGEDNRDIDDNFFF